MPDLGPPPTDDENRETWRRFLRADSYGLVLVLILLVLMLPTVVPDDRPWRSVVVVLATASVLVSLHTSRVPVWSFWTAVVLTAIAYAGLGIDISRDDAHAVSFTIVAILLIAAPVAILNRIARHGHITIRTLLGAVDVYLQIGIAFSFFYQAFFHFDPDSFTGLSEFNRAAFDYFSFVTLTTLGYGDALPVTPFIRNVAVIEAVLGQVFLVVVVAQVVTRLGSRRDTPSDDRRRVGAERDS